MLLKRRKIDMLQGSLFRNIWSFVIPFMLTTFVQHFYNAADLWVVGQFSNNSYAVAGIGATGPITNLVLNFFVGFTAGITITVGRALGAKDADKTQKCVHTSIAFSIIGGATVAILGIILTKSLLLLTDTPTEVIPQAKIYMQLIFVGKFPTLIYNAGSAILRANGDSTRPFYIVLASGILNIALNLVFVLCFGMAAEGVAIATLISQAFSCTAVIYLLTKESDAIKLVIKKINFSKTELFEIIRVGLPSGIQNTVFSISNVIVQKSINYFGHVAMTGSSAAASIGTFFNAAVSAFYQVSVAFTSQNVGARKYDRIKKIMLWCFVNVTIIWAIEVIIVLLFKEQLIGMYCKEIPEAISWGVKRLTYVGCFYGLLGYMNTMTGVLRGMGYSITSMISSIVGVCGIRLGWIFTVFAKHKTFETLFVCFPLSWLGTTLFYLVVYLFVSKKYQDD